MSTYVKPTGTNARLTPEQKAEIIKLRASDPKKWTYCALAAKFGAGKWVRVWSADA